MGKYSENLLSVFFMMKYFLLSITLLCVVGHSLASCPTRCRCTHFLLGLYDSVECSNMSISELPWGNLDDILGKLDLSFNKFTVLKNDTFLDREINFLEKLLLNNNGITTIEINAFRGMRHLTYLNLRHNNITTIDPDVFKGVPELRILHMNNNPHLRLPETGFHLPMLRILDLGRCNLNAIPSNFFANVTSLDILNMYGNRLSFLDPKLIEPLAELEYLDLRGNRFTQLQVDLLVLPHTLDIDFQGNPFNCNCELLYAYSIYKTRAHNEKLTCSTPKNMAFLEPSHPKIIGQCSVVNVGLISTVNIFLLFAVLLQYLL